MQNNYIEIFSLRGNSYDDAMQLFPLARKSEFMQVIDATGIQPGMTIADVPSGGGYLKNFLMESVTCLEHEACGAFHGSAASHSENTALLPLPWATSSIDAFISLAGLHHQEDKYAFFKEAFRVVKPTGTMVISDVMESSNVALFLDQFVGANNSTGHEGMYMNQATERDIENAGWVIKNIAVNDFMWKFASTSDMALFCRKLFDMPRATDEEIINAIHEYLGIVESADGFGMHWQLKTVTAEKLV